MIQNLETNDSGFRMFNLEFNIIVLKASILASDWFFSNSGIPDSGIEGMTDEQLASFVNSLPKEKLKGLIKLSFYEGRVGDIEEMANISSKRIQLT